MQDSCSNTKIPRSLPTIHQTWHQLLLLVVTYFNFSEHPQPTMLLGRHSDQRLYGALGRALDVELQVSTSSLVSAISHLCSFLGLSLSTCTDEVKKISSNQHPNPSPTPVYSTPRLYLEFAHCFSSPPCFSFSHRPSSCWTTITASCLVCQF